MWVEYTKRRNLNRGYMKLDVWNNAQELSRVIHKVLKTVQNRELRLHSQIIDAAQSISANIAEGYCRRTINEYLQFVNVALGSAGELMSRMVGLKELGMIDQKQFDDFDTKHFEVENKLLSLARALQAKRKDGTWIQEVHEPNEPYT